MTTHHPVALPPGDTPRASYDDPLTPGQQEWLALLCRDTADIAAAGIARDFIRLGKAHEWLMIAHLDTLLQHRGIEHVERLLAYSLIQLSDRSHG